LVMYCRNCGEQMNDNQAICVKCGVKAGEGSNYCANCGNTIAPNAAVCLSCGVAVKKAGAGNLAGHDKILILVLCFFLGGIGVHNFVMGETKKGVFKIIASLCCGIGFIFVIIDFIKICMNSYEVNPEKLI